jgi:predicted nuclease with TOPRIM domain
MPTNKQNNSKQGTKDRAKELKAQESATRTRITAERATESLDSIKGKFEELTKRIGELNKNVEILRNIEGLQLAADYITRKQTVARDKDHFAAQGKHMVESNARNEAGLREVAKRITLLHGFLAGDSRDQTKERLNIASLEHTDSIKKHRSIGMAQMNFLNEKGLSNIAGLNKEGYSREEAKQIRKEWDELSSFKAAASDKKSLRRAFKEGVDGEPDDPRRRFMMEDIDKKNRGGTPRELGEEYKRKSGTHATIIDPRNAIILGDILRSAVAVGPASLGGAANGKVSRGLLKKISGEGMDMSMQIGGMSGGGNVNRHMSDKEFAEAMKDPARGKALLGPELYEAYISGSRNMSYNPAKGTLTGERIPKNKNQNPVMPLLQQIADCSCGMFDLMKGNALLDKENARETKKTKGTSNKAMVAGLAAAAAGGAGILGGLGALAGAKAILPSSKGKMNEKQAKQQKKLDKRKTKLDAREKNLKKQQQKLNSKVKNHKISQRNLQKATAGLNSQRKTLRADRKAFKATSAAFKEATAIAKKGASKGVMAAAKEKLVKLFKANRGTMHHVKTALRLKNAKTAVSAAFLAVPGAGWIAFIISWFAWEAVASGLESIIAQVEADDIAAAKSMSQSLSSGGSKTSMDQVVTGTGPDGNPLEAVISARDTAFKNGKLVNGGGGNATPTANVIGSGNKDDHSTNITIYGVNPLNELNTNTKLPRQRGPGGG